MMCRALKDESRSTVVLNNFFSETIFSFNLTDILLSYFRIIHFLIKSYDFFLSSGVL